LTESVRQIRDRGFNVFILEYAAQLLIKRKINLIFFLAFFQRCIPLYPEEVSLSFKEE
jgi:hypothetical protein